MSCISSTTPFLSYQAAMHDNVVELTKKRVKLCRVCGDVASGFNFSVVSCESCKSFFRRNAKREITGMSCPYEDSCDINKGTRRSCKKCRIKKCFIVGMKYDVIPDAPSPTRTNTCKRKSIHSSGIPDTTTMDSALQRALMPRRRKTPPNDKNSTSAQTLSACLCEVKTPNLDMPKDLPCNEQALLDELLASHIRLSHDEVEKFSSLIFWQDKIENLNPDRNAIIMEHAFMFMIEWCKKLAAFNILSQQDQIALLKGCINELHFLGSVHSCMIDEQQFHYTRLNPEMPPIIFTFGQIKSRHPFEFELIYRYTMTFHPDWQNDSALILILRALILFHPERQDLTNVDTIKKVHDSYRSLLRLYNERKYGKNAKSTYVSESLFVKLAELHQLQYTPAKIFMEAKPENIGPLIHELFDLKSLNDQSKSQYFNFDK